MLPDPLKFVLGFYICTKLLPNFCLLQEMIGAQIS